MATQCKSYEEIFKYQHHIAVFSKLHSSYTKKSLYLLILVAYRIFSRVVLLIFAHCCGKYDDIVQNNSSSKNCVVGLQTLPVEINGRSAADTASPASLTHYYQGTHIGLLFSSFRQALAIQSFFFFLLSQAVLKSTFGKAGAAKSFKITFETLGSWTGFVLVENTRIMAVIRSWRQTEGWTKSEGWCWEKGSTTTISKKIGCMLQIDTLVQILQKNNRCLGTHWFYIIRRIKITICFCENLF